MDRIKIAADELKKRKINNVVDIGCRDCRLQEIGEFKSYRGVDLFQNQFGTVTDVIDVMNFDFPMSTDSVVALDVLEHLDNPQLLTTKIFNSRPKNVIINLPNIYDFKGIFKFLFGRLGEKYKFNSTSQLDRHRWIMSNVEIAKFYKDIATKNNYSLTIIPITSGGLLGKLLNPIFPRLFTTALIGVFDQDVD